MKATRKSLVFSVLSLVLCLAMLIGTTFAWFTDTATTGVNKIQSGNLDIELEYKTTAMTDYDEVTTGTKNIFGTTAWEPGHVEVVYFRVTNAGSLALQYQMGTNVISKVIGESVLGNEIDLANYLNLAILKDPAADLDTREKAIAAAEANPDGVVSFQSLTKHSTLLPADKGDNVDEIAMVVWMPTTVGNAANHKTGTTPPEINFGVTVVATQFTSETDSFNDQYDFGAAYPVVAPAVGEALTQKTTQDSTDPTDVTVMDGETAEESLVVATVPAENYTQDGEYTTTVTVELADSSADSTTYDISVVVTDPNGAAVTLSENYPATIKVQLAEDLKDVKVNHVGYGPMTLGTSATALTNQQYYYDAGTGTLYVCTASFSDFEVTYATSYEATINGKGYASLANAVAAAADGDTVVLNANVESGLINVVKDVTLDLNGKALTMNKSIQVLGSEYSPKYNGKLTVKNGTITSNSYVLAYGSVALNNASFVTTNAYGIYNVYGNVTIDKTSSVKASTYTLFANNGAQNTVTMDIYGKVDVDYGFAITGNGTNNWENSSVINIYDGAEITSAQAAAIYHPQNGTMNVYGGTIKGVSAIGINNGTVNVYGGNIIGNGGAVDEVVDSYQGGGLYYDGAAIMLPIGYGSTTLNIDGENVNITSANNYAIHAYKVNGTNNYAEVVINNGTLTSALGDIYIPEICADAITYADNR